MRKNKFLFLVFCILCIAFFTLDSVSSASILDELHLNVQTVDGGGNVISGTFNFVFNISTTEDCNNVIYSDSATLTTDSRGIISHYLSSASMDYGQQYYLCYYRNGALIDVAKIARSPYAFRAKYVNVSGIQVDSNLNLSGYNLTANYLFGSGKYLTDISSGAINASEVNYWLKNGSNLYYDGGKVGIGTTNPSAPLTIQQTDDSSGFKLIGKTDPTTIFSFYIGSGGTNNPRFSSTKSMVFEANQAIHFRGPSGLYLNDNNAANVGIASGGGKVGIGITSPQEKLHVAGNALFNGTINLDGNKIINLANGTLATDAVTLSQLQAVNGSLMGDLDGYVPYVGAMQNVDLGNNNLSVNSMNFGTYGNLGVISGRYAGNDVIAFGNQGSSWQRIVMVDGTQGTNSGFAFETSSNSGSSWKTEMQLYGGNLGIGTISPQQKLHVNGSAVINGTLIGLSNATEPTGAVTLAQLQAVNVSATANEGDPFWTSNMTNVAFKNAANMFTQNNVFNGNLTVGNNNFFVNNNTGNVGVGTISPTAKLDVFGNLRINNNEWISSRDSSGTGVVNMFKVNSNNEIDVGGTLNIGSLVFSEDSGLVTAMNMPVSSTPSIGTPQGYVFRMDSENILSVYSEADGSGGVQNKRVGIGTISPSYTLDVVGSARFTQGINSGGELVMNNNKISGLANGTLATDAVTLSQLQSVNSSATAAEVDPYWSGNYSNVAFKNQANTFTQNNVFNGNLTVGNNNFFVDNNTGNVGIGTTSPQQKLEVVGNANVTANMTISGMTIYKDTNGDMVFRA